MSEVSAWFRKKVSRRGLLWGGLAAAGGSAIAGTAAGQSVHSGHGAASAAAAATPPAHLAAHGSMITVGEVDNERNGFDPSRMVTDWETGSVSKLPDGRILRTFEIEAVDKEIEIAPGIMFPAWTYNGRVPGLRSGRPKASTSGSSSATPARIPTPCTSTAYTPQGWTASPVQD